MKYYVRNGTKKYDNVLNAGKGWYRNWAVVLELNGQKYVAFHNENYHKEVLGWETSDNGPIYWKKLKAPKAFYGEFHQVGGEECSEAYEALWYKFEEDKEKVEMEKVTNSKIEFLKSLETDNAQKQHDNTPVYDVKTVMRWLLEGEEVVYHTIMGGTEGWNRLDPEKPLLDGDVYEYQLAENTKSKWSFRMPEYTIEASSREDALQKAYNLIVDNPSYIVVYPRKK